MQTIAAILLYPGLLTALVAGGLYRVLLRRGLGSLPIRAALTSREGLAAGVGVLLGALGLALLPWPFRPTDAGIAWLWAWVAFELAFLLPLLPALAAGAPAVVRAAVREAQLGTLARALLWAALTTALLLRQHQGDLIMVAQLLSLLAALIALLPVLGWGPFAAEDRLTPGGVTAGVDEAGVLLDSWSRDLRAGMLLTALLVTGLPLTTWHPLITLLVTLLGLIVVPLLLRRLEGRWIRMTLPYALRFCLVWIVPPILVALVALVITLR